MLCMASCGVGEAVIPWVGVKLGVIGVALGAIVEVAGGEGETGVAVAGPGVAVTTMAVWVLSVGSVGRGCTVIVAKSVGGGIGDGVAVMNAGLPNSLHPRSGAGPTKPVIGIGGTFSPFAATNWAMPLSIAGEPDWSTRPLKSSSTVCHVPSRPGFGAA